MKLCTCGGARPIDQNDRGAFYAITRSANPLHHEIIALLKQFDIITKDKAKTTYDITTLFNNLHDKKHRHLAISARLSELVTWRTVLTDKLPTDKRKAIFWLAENVVSPRQNEVIPRCNCGD